MSKKLWIFYLVYCALSGLAVGYFSERLVLSAPLLVIINAFIGLILGGVDLKHNA